MTLSIHPDLVRAYREADYRVAGDREKFTLRVGCVCSELAGLMVGSRAVTAAFFIAPPGLSADIVGRGLESIAGECVDPSGKRATDPGLLVLGVSLQDADALALRHQQNAFLWISTPVGLPSLKLMNPLQVPAAEELGRWRASLPAAEARAAEALPNREQALLMAIPRSEIRHWLLPELWDIRQPWPLALPDGGAMGIGTELDRMFKLVAAGLVPAISSFTD
jgi:hypothetical protein